MLLNLILIEDRGEYVTKATVITKATVVAKAVVTVMVKQKRGSKVLPLFLLIGLSWLFG